MDFNLFVTKWNDDLKLFEIMTLSTLLLWVIILNLLMCECGERVTNHFVEFSVEFGRCEWNKLPIELQRKYLIFLLDTQQPKNIQAYGDIRCTRETFRKVFQ